MEAHRGFWRADRGPGVLLSQGKAMKKTILFLLLATAAHGQFGNATKLRGKNICAPFAPTNLQTLSWDGTNLCFTTAAGGGSGASSTTQVLFNLSNAVTG